MLTGELRSQVDAIWNAFWSGGISNPMEVLEQITYLLFIRRLDDAHTLEENKALTLGKPIENRVFPAGKDERGREYQDLRWSRFKNFCQRSAYTGQRGVGVIRPAEVGDGGRRSRHIPATAESA